MAKKEIEAEYETKIVKYRRIHVPKPLYQFQTGDKVIVTLRKVEGEA